MELMGKPDEVLLSLKEFVKFNVSTAPVGVTWDALKAFLQGILIQQVVKIKRKSREWKELIRKEVIKAEKQYVEDTTPEKQRIWLNQQQIIE